MDSGKVRYLPENPREKANIFSYLTFGWLLQLFFKGRKKELQATDLYAVLDEHKSKRLSDQMSKSWSHELLKRKNDKSPSLLRAVLRVFGWQILTSGILLFMLELTTKIPQPMILGLLVSFYSDPEGHSENAAYIYAGALIITTALNVIFFHPIVMSQSHLGMKMRLAVCSMIYRKTLRLSKTALGDTTTGQVVNLISNDVGRLEQSILNVHYLWIGPAETFIFTYLMYLEIGVSAFAGVVFTLAFIPLQSFLGSKTSYLRLRTALRTDERVRFMNEIIQGIQVIKMYAWEKPFGKLVAMARKREVNVLRYVSHIRGLMLCFAMFQTRTAVFLSLLVYALLFQVATAQQAFSVASYYAILKTMTMFFPQGISQLAETLVSLKRIETFLLYDETHVIKAHEERAKKNPPPFLTGQSRMENFSINSDHESDDVEDGIVISHLKAKWTKNSDYTLNDISLRVKTGSLVAVIGPVGSGKSSLIQAILGELPVESGTITINGKLSYASQEPWLFSGTVRQNILFGKPMNKRRYREVIRRCALQTDFDIFAYGDKTIVGDRGVSLSGGQKARINLARAVYRDSAVYLLDDPLSAVDTHVGRHLFDKCMRGFLRDKVVILVTHQLQFLQEADQIVILEDGKISGMGTYDSLRESGVEFAKMLADPEESDSEKTKSQRSHSITYSKLNDRRASEVSVEESVENAAEDPMEMAEKGNVGSLGLKLYAEYFKAGGGYCALFNMLSTAAVAQVLASGSDYFLQYWVDKNEANAKSPGADYSNFDMEYDDYTTKLDFTDLYVFTMLTIATIIITITRSVIFFQVAMKASQQLHAIMFKGVVRASMYFFNTNPTGRILNRFSKDMGQVDEILPTTMLDVIQIFGQMLAIIVLVVIINYWLIVPSLIFGIVFYFLRDFFLKTSRSVKRIENITRSPVYSHLSASLLGLSTIRAFKAQDVLLHEFDNHQDMHSCAFFTFTAINRSFGFWTDSVCVLYITIVTLSFFLGDLATGGNVGLALSQAMSLTGMVQYGMRQSAELENSMTSLERVVEYGKFEPEGRLEVSGDKKPPAEWPDKGQIKFNRIFLRYFPQLEAEKVLKSLSFEISACEKVGIVGRTGAGKSSVINALFRLAYNEGEILIDGQNIEKMGLHDLRSKISIIPQEPVLFSGTMRYNLDPFNEYSDEKLWKALEEVELKDVIRELVHGLESQISEGGSNFSVGQRQLVCLARAILRDNKILLMDEATANVDPQTDALIQTTIRRKFKDCTVLTIAHRLHTVMDSDKVIVMDAGQAIEIGAPYELLTKSSVKAFEGMVRQLGNATYETLLGVAKKRLIKEKLPIESKYSSPETVSNSDVEAEISESIE